ncbi:ATP-binding cassette domain-containing protein [Inquilinus limosus]|uniref:ABC transporter ATP-binding protein n=1 Tax=Inquilinus limosus TaxID=171674 RepID=UPI0004294B3A|nr:ATP-binding cassette domain-containing protein [Inquilinus limosus]
MIVLDRVSKRYRSHGTGQSKLVFDDVSAVFESGRTVGILGKRGAGKSTLIRLIAGAIPPDSGRVLRRGRVSFLVGTAGPFVTTMTGRENVWFTARLYGADAREVIRFVEAHAGLGADFDKPFSAFTGDKRSRLLFTTAYALPFDIYLADESLIGGPPGFRDWCERLVDARRQQATLVFTTKRPRLLRRFADTGAVLADARLQTFSSVRDAILSFKSDEPAADDDPPIEDVEEDEDDELPVPTP